MNFLLLYYGDEAAEDALPVVEQRRLVNEHEEFTDRLTDDGVLLFATALDESAAATRVADGVVTDGPFNQTRDQIGGLCAIQCQDLDQALAYAKQVPKSPGLTVEVRPLLEI